MYHKLTAPYTPKKVGEYVEFKCDIEQSARIIEVRRNSYIVAAPADGFSGHYIGRDDTAEVMFEDDFDYRELIDWS